MRSKLASSIAILLNYGAKWRALYYIFYVLCLDLELSIVLNGRNLFSDIEEQSVLDSASTLRDRSIFSYFMRSFDIFNYAYSGISAYFLFCIYLVIAGYFSFAMVALPSKTWRRLVEGRISSHFLMSIIIGNYFFLMFYGYQTIRLFYCKQYEIPVNNQSIVSDATEAYTSAFFKNQNRKIQTKWISVSTLAPDLVCYSTAHIALIVISLASCFLAFSLKVFYVKLVGSTFTLRLLAERAHTEWFRAVIYLLMALLRLGYYVSTGNEMSNTTYFYLGIGVCLADYLLHIFIDSYFSSTANLLRSLDTGLVLFCVTCVVVERNIFFGITGTKSFTTSYIFEALLLILMAKLTMIIKKADYSGLSMLNDKRHLSIQLEELAFGCLAYLEEFTEKSSTKIHKKKLAERLFASLKLFRYRFPTEKILIETLANILNSYTYNKSFNSSSSSELSSRTGILGLAPITIEGNFFPDRESIMSTVEEQPILEFKAVVNFLDLVLSAYFRETSFAHMQNSSRMVAILSHFNLVYKVKPLFALEALRQRVRAGSERDFNMLIMEKVIKFRIEDALSTGNYFLAGRSHHLVFNTPQVNKIDMSRVTYFLQKMEDLKSSVSKLLKMKIKVSKVGLDEQFDASTLYATAHKFRETVERCELLLKKLAGLVGETASTPLLMLEAFFRVHLIFQTRRGFVLAQTLAQKPFRCGFRNLTHIEYLQDRKVVRHALEKLVIIGVSAERDTFHQITSATSNAPLRLGFTSAELLGSDLACLVSEPIRSRHAELMRPEKGRGVLLEQKAEQELYVKTKHGWVQKTRVALRLHAEREGGVVVMGRLNCEEEGEEVAQLIVTSDLQIAEVTKSAHDHFEASTCLKEHGNELCDMVAEFLRASKDLYLKQEHSNNVDIVDAVELNLQRVARYRLLQEKVDLPVVNRFGNTLLVTANVKELFYRATKEFVIIVSYKVRSCEWDRHKANLGESNQDDGLNHVPSSIQSTSMGKASYKLLSPIERSPNIISEDQASEKISLLEVKADLGLKFEASVSKISQAVAKLDLLIKKRVMARMNLMLRRSPTSKQAAPQYHQSKTQKRRVVRQAVDSDDIRKPVKEQSLADVSSTHTMRLTNMGKSLSAKLGFQQLYNMLLIGSVVICLIFVAELIFSHITYSRGIRKYSEIGLRAKTMDTASWTLYTANAYHTIVDFNRLVLDGAIPVEYFAEFGIENLLEMATGQKWALHNYLMLYFSNAIMDIDDTIKDPKIVEITKTLAFKVPEDLGSEKLTTVELPQVEAIVRIHLYLESYLWRDDLNAWNTTAESEEVLRYNLINCMLDMAVDISTKTNRYIMNLSTEILDSMYLCCYIPIACLIVLLLLASCRLFYIKTKLIPVVRNIVNFRSKDLQVSILVLERQWRGFNELTADTYSAYFKFSKYLVQVPEPKDLNLSQGDSVKTKMFEAAKIWRTANPENHKMRGVVNPRPRTEPSTRTTLKKSSFAFGMGLSILLFVLDISVWAGFRWIIMFPDIKQSRVLRNLVQAYDLTVDLWNMNSNLQTILLAEITSGTQTKVRYQPASAEFDYFLSRFSEELIPRYSEMRNQNLGSFNSYVLNFTNSNFSLCNSLKQRHELYTYCGEGATAIFDSNVPTVLTKLASILRSMQNLVLKSENLTSGYQYLKNQDLKTYFFYCNFLATSGLGVTEEIYYSAMMGIAPAIDEIINLMLSNTSDWTFLINNLPFTIVFLLFGWLVFRKRILVVPKNCSYMTYLFDSGLLESNAWLSGKLKRVAI